MAGGDAVALGRLGGVRAGERASLPECDSLCRSWCAARPANGRCDGALCRLSGASRRCALRGNIRRGIEFIRAEQEPDGSWFGRWGANYIYGTWSALVALNGAGEDMSQPYIRRAVEWLKSRQREDGGWGEGLETYEEWGAGYAKVSTPSQTAWALLGLMSAGEVESDTVREGIRWLEEAPREGVRWEEQHFTGTGFPRVFYLKYHGYAASFPLWALGRYQRVMESNDRKVPWGM